MIGKEDIIKRIIDGCSENPDTYLRYLKRTSWRVDADFKFISKELPHVGSVLDIGGTPPLLAGLLKESGVKEVTVLDPKVSIFKNYLQSAGISAIEGDALSSHFDWVTRPYELVCFCEVIEHLTGNIVATLKKLTNALLARGGYFYLTTPNLRSLSGAAAVFIYGSGLASKPRESVQAQYNRASSNYGYFGHIREYTGKEIVGLMESLGFQHVKSKYQIKPLYRSESGFQRVISFLEILFPRMRRFGKYLFKKK